MNIKYIDQTNGVQSPTPLLKMHNRDLTYTKSDNVTILKLLVELKARQQPPIHVPTMRETGQIYGSQFQHIPNSDLSGMVHPNGSVSWGIPDWYRVPKVLHHGWAELYAEYQNISIVEAVLLLAKRYGIDTNKPMEMAVSQTLLNIDGDRYPLPEGEMNIDGIIATHRETIRIACPKHGTHYLLAMFQTPCGKVSHLPYYKAFAGPSDDPQTYLWGFSPKEIPISELDILERHPSATILLTDDAWLAHRINCCLQSLGEPIQLVATSIWAGISRLDDYSFEALLGRRIVYLPTLHKDALAAGIHLRDVLHDVGIEDFRVLMKPFAKGEASIKAAKTECGEYATEKAVVFSRRNVLYLLDDIQNAWPFPQYKKYCKDEGFIEMEAQPTEEAKPTLFIPATSISDAAKDGEVDVAFSVESVFASSNITVIVGDSNAGKSMFVRTLAISISTGTNAFGMEASRARNVYSINAEQDVQKSDTYTKRAMAAQGVNEIPDRFYDFPELSTSSPEGFGPLDVLDADWQDLILEEMAPDSVLIIDNLLAASQKGLSHESVGRGLKRLAKRLQAKQSTLVVIHHTAKNGDAMGSKALQNLAQNFILIHESEQREGFEGGVNALVTFRELKGCPPYTGKQFHAHLEYATGAEGTPWVFEEVGTTSPEIKLALRQKPDVAGLHEIQQAALSYASDHGQVARRHLVTMGHNEESVKKHLTELVAARRLIRHGNGRGTYYTLATQNETS